MIVKDEEDVIERCLKSTKDLFDEIIIVDTGSTDKTKNIIKNYTDKIYDFKWIDDFSKARNFAFGKATSDYIMWLDADDVIFEEDLEKMHKLKSNIDNNVNIYLFQYNIAFDKDNNPTFSYNRERLMKNNKQNKWQDQVHEYIPLTGEIRYTDIAISHKKEKTGESFRNLNIYKTMKKKGKKFTPRNRYYFARELYDHSEYKEAAQEFKKFIDSKKGWIEDNINACILLANCYDNLNGKEKAFDVLFHSFVYDKPRKKTCCLIGNRYLNEGKYDLAIAWYRFALVTEVNKSGFYESDYDEFIPYLNLCVCYDKIGKKEEAKNFHELTKQLKPDHPSVLYNEEYFNKE